MVSKKQPREGWRTTIHAIETSFTIYVEFFNFEDNPYDNIKKMSSMLK